MHNALRGARTRAQSAITPAPLRPVPLRQCHYASAITPAPEHRHASARRAVCKRPSYTHHREYSRVAGTAVCGRNGAAAVAFARFRMPIDDLVLRTQLLSRAVGVRL